MRARRSLRVSARSVLVCCSLLALAGAAHAGGKYQRAKDEKTLVWNNHPKPGEFATWDGDRDEEGYAKGFGTLTWYTPRSTVYAHYFGNMVSGKFDGPVNVHAGGKTAHAIFVKGDRMAGWMIGPAPSRMAAIKSREPAPRRIMTTPKEQRALAGSAPVSEPDTPAEGPAVAKESSITESEERTVNPPTKAKPKPPDEDLLRSLVRPPPSLRDDPAAGTSEVGTNPERATDATLTKHVAIALAETQARLLGHDVSKYECPTAHYDVGKGAWIVVYERIPSEEITPPDEPFSVVVDDKTKKTTVLPRR